MPGGCPGGGECPLRLEHRGEPGPVVDRGPDLRGREDRRERRHTAKNVVCPSPAGGCRIEASRRSPARRRASPAPAGRAAREPGRRRSRRPRPGKYMRVAARFSSPRAKTPTRRCGACSPPSGHGTGPGLRVANAKRPPSTVPERPKPRKPPRAGVPSRSSLGWSYRPAAFACQISIIPSAPAAPAPSSRAAVDPDRPRIGGIDDVRSDQISEETDAEVRADRLRGRQAERQWS